MTRIEFVIDDLVLVGFDPRDRHRIGDAVQRELSSLSATAQHALRTSLATGTLMPVLRAPDVQLSRPHDPDASGRLSGDAIGTGIAQSILNAMTLQPVPQAAGRPTPTPSTGPGVS
jgi:hypothetical protein